MLKRILLFVSILIVVGCSIPDFQNMGIPTWNTTFNLYILNDTYQAADFAEEDSSLVAYGDTLGLYETATDTGDIEFSSDPSSNNEFMEIGEIYIDNPDPTTTNIPLSQVDPNLVNGPIPAPGIAPFIMPEIVKDDVEPFGEFQEISFISGQVIISLTNNTAIWFGDVNAGHPLVVHILDMNDVEILAQSFSEDIPPDNTQTISESIDMAGQTMVNEIKISITGGSRGTDGQAATIDIDATLDIEVEVIDLVADHAIAQLPVQTVVDSVIVVLDEAITIFRGDIAEGNYTITLDIENSIDMDIEATLHISKLILEGETEYFSEIISIPRSGGPGQVTVQTEVFDISNSVLGEAPDYDSPLETIKLLVDATMVDSGDEYREIDFDDAFNVDIEVSSLEFGYVKGILDPKVQDPISGSTTLGIEYPHIIGTFNIVSFSTITFDFFTPIPTEMELEFTSFNADDESVQLIDINNNSNPILDIPSGSSEIVLTSDEYNINELISILPDSIYYTIYPIVGDSTEIFYYEEGDQIETEIAIESLLDFEADCWIIPKAQDGSPDVQKVNTQQFEEKFIDAFVDGNIILHYNNELGIQAGINILISQTSPEGFEELVNPDSTIYTIITVDDLMYPTSNEQDSIIVNVSREDLDFFVEDSVFIIPKLKLFSEPGSPVSGSISMQGELSLEIEVSNDLAE